MTRDLRLYLDDILDSIARIEEYTQGLSAEAFIAQPLIQDAVIRRIEIMLSQLLRGPLNRVAQVDWRGRLWLATTRLGTRGSLLHVLDGSEYQGSIQVSDRFLAFQVVDSLLVVLVESLKADSLGLHPRRIDWYTIVEAHSAR